MDQLRKYADLAGFGERLRWAAVVSLAILVSILEAVGAYLIYALLGLASGTVDSTDLPIIGRYAGSAEDRVVLLFTVGSIAVFFIFRTIVLLGKQYVESRVVENAGARLSGRLVHCYLHMPYIEHIQRNSAELIRNAYSTVQSMVGKVFKPLINIVSESLVVAGLVVVLVATAPLATVSVVAVLGIASSLLLHVIYGRLKALGRTNQDLAKETLRSLQQSLEGMRDIKVLGQERFFESHYVGARVDLAKVRYVRDLLSATPAVLLETIMVLFIAAFFAISVTTGDSGTAAIPVLGLFGYAALRLKPSVARIASAINSLKFASAGIDDVYSDLRHLETEATEPRADAGPLPFHRKIELEDVSFRYPGTSEFALRSVSLTIGAGESIGVVGPTGGGKTTLLDLLLGLLPPTQGSIRVDGVNIRDNLRAWQANLGIVPQDLFLIDDTLRRNIALGVSDSEIDEEAVRQAVELAQLGPVVESLPRGLGSALGERGVRLSGGQRQRVAIARALYRRPQVLVLDEGTSALDNQTEADLLAALKVIRSQHTVITVAHRLSTVRNCDRIVLIEDGCVAGIGSYEQLVSGELSMS